MFFPAPETFSCPLEQLRQFGEIITAVITHPIDFASKFIEGASQGLGNFFNNIGKFLGDFLYNWLFDGLDFNKELVPEQWNNWDGWIAFLADLVGVSWDKILDVATEEFGGDIALVVDLYTEVSDFVGKGWSGLTEWLGSAVANVKSLLNCAGPNCSRICCQNKAVWIPPAKDADS